MLLLAFGLWRLLATPATPPIAGDDDPDFARVRAILASAEEPNPANLALLGDKRFLFSESGELFLMFGVRGRSWIALGPPVGRARSGWSCCGGSASWPTPTPPDRASMRIGPDVLPDLVELGFAIQKTGECAAVPLDSFSLQGRRRGNLRRNWRKAGEDGRLVRGARPARRWFR